MDDQHVDLIHWLSMWQTNLRSLSLEMHLPIQGGRAYYDLPLLLGRLTDLRFVQHCFRGNGLQAIDRYQLTNLRRAEFGLAHGNPLDHTDMQSIISIAPLLEELTLHSLFDRSEWGVAGPCYGALSQLTKLELIGSDYISNILTWDVPQWVMALSRLVSLRVVSELPAQISPTDYLAMFRRGLVSLRWLYYRIPGHGNITMDRDVGDSVQITNFAGTRFIQWDTA
jgi:hypothetical protein